MVRPQQSHNLYEEDPDETKELSQKAQGHKGEKVVQEVSKETLAQEHDRHLKFHTENALQPRNIILPMSYCPSKVSLSQAKRTRIRDLRIATGDLDEVILLRTLTEPVVHSASVTIVEDEHGEIARLTVCNLEDSMNDPVLSKDSTLAIRQPRWTIAPYGGYYIRVDHPSDLVLLDLTAPLVPFEWRSLDKDIPSKTAAGWKKEGDMMFLKKKFRQALACYERGRKALGTDAAYAVLIDLYRKRCGVNIVLLRFDDASKDLAHAIKLHAKSEQALHNSDLADFDAVKAWLYSKNMSDPLHIASRISRPLRDLAVRIKFDIGVFQTTADYDFPRLSSSVGPLNLHIDAASYTSDTEVKQTFHHGRGLFAKRDFLAGDLIMAEKAFAMPGYLVNDRSSECSLYSLELVQKLTANPSLRREFFDMDDGGYWPVNAWEITAGEDIPVDVFRVEHIRRRNCFAAPMRSVDVLTQATPVRNGFWIHTSYINHSCLPNSVRTFLGDMLFLRTTRHIRAGDEITAQYVTPELTLGERQEKYKSTWGFECDCRLCQVDDQVGPAVEQERMALFNELKVTAQKLGAKPTKTALKRFAKRLRELEVLYREDHYADLPKLCLVHPTLFLTEAWRGVKNTDKMIESATKLLRYFGIEVLALGIDFEIAKNSGLVNVECVRALKYLAEGYTTKGQPELASSILRTAKVWFKTITGTDVGSEEFLKI
ncbi:hypothetical protein EK21DRAFT_57881 [Setomelanomma holmii]|uniref:SET domain-containing protein n=1 Tax=Setomelanomma holmii TaxID=210430 RepID=A0A9P4LSL1_9PLEO|nr:hypothetical protein EK21DRAFT_57881 [Setomelanomma holmii]